MSNTPGISPITPDIEDVRHSEDDDRDFVGGDQPTDDPMDESDNSFDEAEDIEAEEDAEISRSTPR